MRQPAVLLLLIALCLPACAAGTGPASEPAPQTTPISRIRTPLPADATPTRTTIYLPRYFEDGSLGLRGVDRIVASDQPARRALEAFIQGPDGAERAADLNYPLSPRTGIVSFDLANEIATIEFGPELAEVRGRPFSELAYWSIVYTLTEVPGVRGVSLVRSGQPLREFGFPPVPIPAVATRADAPSWVAPR